MNDEDRKARDEAGLYFIDYFSRLFNRRRESPGSDLLTALVQAHDGADRLTEGELLGTAILLLIAGHETTMNLISGSLLWLSRDASAWEQLVRGGVTRSAVDELLRLVAPVQLTGRTMLEDMDVGGTTLEKGSFALLLLAGANRDPDVFADPTRLDLTRDPNPQLGFGFGLHHCLGSPLARLEAEVTLEELLATGRRIEVTGPIRYRPNIVLRGLAELEIVLAS
jgi:cytochrome P450